eukprot:1945803-Alexandrium_andersonii.AAC.1
MSSSLSSPWFVPWPRPFVPWPRPCCPGQLLMWLEGEPVNGGRELGVNTFVRGLRQIEKCSPSTRVPSAHIEKCRVTQHKSRSVDWRT